jgi:hypothetical protein
VPICRVRKRKGVRPAQWQTRWCSTKRGTETGDELTTGKVLPDLGGGWRRTRRRACAGAGRPGGDASGRRACPGTASRSSRSSTSPTASPLFPSAVPCDALLPFPFRFSDPKRRKLKIRRSPNPNFEAGLCQFLSQFNQILYKLDQITNSDTAESTEFRQIR